MSGLIDLALSSLLTAWLVTAVFWALTGWALASWGRIPVAAGAAIGFVVPVFGAAGIGIWALARRSGERRDSGQGGGTGVLGLGGFGPPPALGGGPALGGAGAPPALGATSTGGASVGGWGSAPSGVPGGPGTAGWSTAGSGTGTGGGTGGWGIGTGGSPAGWGTSGPPGAAAGWTAPVAGGWGAATAAAGSPAAPGWGLAGSVGPVSPAGSAELAPVGGTGWPVPVAGSVPGGSAGTDAHGWPRPESGSARARRWAGRYGVPALWAGLTFAGVASLLVSWVDISVPAALSASFGAFDLGLGLFMLLTVAALGAACALSFRTTNRLTAIAVAWCACWWLLISVLVLRTADIVAGLLPDRALPQAVAGSAVQVSPVWTLIAFASILALALCVGSLVLADRRRWVAA